MSDNPTNGNGSKANGSGPADTSIGAQVARQLFGLVAELAENRRAHAAQEIRITGLAQVIGRGIPFGSEQAEEVAAVIQEAGDIDHARGSLMYDRATAVRRVRKAG